MCIYIICIYNNIIFIVLSQDIPIPIFHGSISSMSSISPFLVQHQEIKVTCFLGALVVDGASCTLLGLFHKGALDPSECSKPDSSRKNRYKLTHIAMERFTCFLIGKPSINGPFSMAMLVITRW